MTQPYHDPGAVHPIPMWVKVIFMAVLIPVIAIYVFNSMRIVPEVQENRDYGKCLFAMMAEHRAGTSKYDLSVASHHGIGEATLDQFTDAARFQNYEGLNSDFLCKGIYDELRDEGLLVRSQEGSP